MRREEIPSFVKWAMFLSPLYILLFLSFIFAPSIGFPVHGEIGGTPVAIKTMTDWSMVLNVYPSITGYFFLLLVSAGLVGIWQARLLVEIVNNQRNSDIWQPKSSFFRFLIASYLTSVLLASKNPAQKTVRLLLIFSLILLILSTIVTPLQIIAVPIAVLVMGTWLLGAQIFAPLYLLLFWYSRLTA